MQNLSHLDEEGRARMVDVSAKPPTNRRATAEAVLRVGEAVMRAIREGATPKGNIFEVARVAGIQAAKRTSEWIPLCHQLALNHTDVDFRNDDERIWITVSASAHAVTGVEMEALTAASAAALTLYDMLKALSKDMVIEHVRLLAKSGGRSGDYRTRESTDVAP